MTPEEYQRIKEAEKEHLRALKKLKEAVHLLKRRQRVNQALSDMVGGSEATFDVHDEMVEKLALETAQQEARLEVALEGATLDETSSADADTEATPARNQEALEAELLEARAKSLLRQIKQEMGTAEEPAPGPAASKSMGRQAPPARPEEHSDPPAAPERPDKTIGRMT